MENKEFNINESYIKSFIERIRPADIEVRKQLDLGYTYDGRNFELHEIRPIWDKPDELMQNPFAKITFVKSQNIWKLYWMRASGKWELYEPLSISMNIQKIIEIIEADEYGCFFG